MGIPGVITRRNGPLPTSRRPSTKRTSVAPNGDTPPVFAKGKVSNWKLDPPPCTAKPLICVSRARITPPAAALTAVEAVVSRLQGGPGAIGVVLYALLLT